MNSWLPRSSQNITARVSEREGALYTIYLGLFSTLSRRARVGLCEVELVYILRSLAERKNDNPEPLPHNYAPAMRIQYTSKDLVDLRNNPSSEF